MLTMVSATNLQNGTLLLPLMDSSGGYSVQDVEGLGPVKATLVSSSLAQQDGAKLNNVRRESRNITMILGLESDFVTNTVAQLRRQLYSYFSPKSEITFSVYEDDEFWGSTSAIVESCEPVMFSADPQVAISLICNDPDFYAPEVTSIDSFTVDDTSTQTITYEGTTETGILFTLTFLEDATGITLNNTRPDGSLDLLELDGAFSNGDVLTINTNDSQKSLILSKAGHPQSVLSYLGTRSEWIKLQPGDNLFRAFYNGTTTPFNLQYTAKFEGF